MHLLTGMDALKARRGARAAASRACGLDRNAAYGWAQVPAERVVAIEIATGIPREQLRPDLYRGRKRRRDCQCSN